MAHWTFATIGNRLLRWGRTFDSSAAVDSHIQRMPTDEAVKYLLAAILEEIATTNTKLTSLVAAQRAANRQVALSGSELPTAINASQPIADARLVCWRLADGSGDGYAQLQKGTAQLIGLQISDAQWLELTPGVRDTLQTASITHFEQLRYKAWCNLKGIGRANIRKVLAWRDRHVVQTSTPITE